MATSAPHHSAPPPSVHHEPEVYATAQQYDADLSAALQQISDHRANVPLLGSNMLNIATMTIMGRLQIDHVNLLKIVTTYDKPRVRSLLQSKGIPPDKYTLIYPDTMAAVADPFASLHERGAKKKTFQNSVILKYEDPVPKKNRKAIKIFCNGAFHVNGCKRVCEFVSVCDIVCEMLDVVFQSFDRKHRLHSFDVQLINTNFVVQQRFDLAAVNQLILDRYDYATDYDVSFHPAVNVKFPVQHRNVTVLVFNTGKIIITGAVYPGELRDAFEFVTNFLDENRDNVVIGEADFLQDGNARHAAAFADTNDTLQNREDETGEAATKLTASTHQQNGDDNDAGSRVGRRPDRTPKEKKTKPVKRRSSVRPDANFDCRIGADGNDRTALEDREKSGVAESPRRPAPSSLAREEGAIQKRRRSLRNNDSARKQKDHEEDDAECDSVRKTKKKRKGGGVAIF